MNPTFHTHDGWHFVRLYDGSVQIERRSAVGTLLETHTLTAESWASVVAHLSARGGTGDTQQAALAFHQAKTP